MTALRPIGYYEYLDFNSPLSSDRADLLAAALVVGSPRSILDAGCGWGELLLRTVAASNVATGLGVDSDTVALDRGRKNAAKRRLSERVQFLEGDIADLGDRADVVICVGADHAFGNQDEALEALRDYVNPGGRLLFGTGFWEREPTDDEAASLDMTSRTLRDLDGLVDKTIAVGFRPLSIHVANSDEWCEFESGYLADWETWLLSHAADPSAGDIRHKADKHRKDWLQGYRKVLGFAYLMLGTPSVSSVERAY
ncbi:MAG: class I SAM-dependent methyltransferase [Acidimicrobiales bacterium]